MILVFLISLLFVLGLCIGSFINALEYRIESEKSIKGRSFCPSCKHQLAWYDLVPVFSWISLGGKCRHCKKQISIQYPIVELITAFSFLGFGFASGLVFKLNSFIVRGSGTTREPFIAGLSLIALLIIAFCLILVALYDYKTGYVLSNYVYFAIIVTFVYLTLSYNGLINKEIFSYFYPYLISGLIPAGFFYLLYFFSKEKWMGAGDVEIAFLMGLFLDWPKVLSGLYFAFIVGSIWGLSKIYLFKKAKMNSEIPFAPFLIAGTFFAFFFGAQLFQIYVRIFLGI